MGLVFRHFCRLAGVVLLAGSLAACASFKQTLQCSLLGGPLGALVGSAVGQGKKAALAGAAVGVTICAIIANQIEKKRRDALARERDLDRQIENEQQANDAVLAENYELRMQLDELQRKKADLQRSRRGSQEERARIVGEIQGEAEAARERIEMVERRIATIDRQLADSRLSAQERDTLQQLKTNLVERRRILQQIAALA
jgi:hypothetical protein